MFTETVTISLERYEQLKRFETLENTTHIARVKNLEEFIVKAFNSSDRRQSEAYLNNAMNICKTLKGYEEK